MYLKGIHGRYAQIVRPFHIFKNLSVPLQIGNDIMKPEKFDLLYSSNRLELELVMAFTSRLPYTQGHVTTEFPYDVRPLQLYLPVHRR